MIRCAFLAGLVFGLTAGCTRKNSETGPAAGQPAAVLASGRATDQEAHLSPPPKPVALPRNPDLERIAKLAHQGDQIAREAWWVATNEKLGVERSPFGKLKRAAQTALDGKLSSKGRFNCDRYLVVPAPGLAKNFEISEFCNPRAGPKKLASWSVTGPHSAKVDFEPSNLGEVLGIGASIFSKRFSCDLVWTDSDVLESMKCPHWEQDRGTAQVVSWQTFDFHRGSGNVLVLRGKVLENLQAVRKIEADVPLAGKIVVTETVTQAPPEAPQPAEKKPEPKKEASQAKPPPPAPGEAPPSQPGMDMIEGGIYIPPVVPDPSVDPATGQPLSPHRLVDPDLMRQQGALPSPPPPPVWTEPVDPGAGVEYSPNPADSGGSHGQDVEQGQNR